MRLKDADALTERFRASRKLWFSLDEVLDEISDATTVEAVPVRQARDICDERVGHWEFTCSNCGADAAVVEGGSLDGAQFNYCPNCGAKMEAAK